MTLLVDDALTDMVADPVNGGQVSAPRIVGLRVRTAAPIRVQATIQRPNGTTLLNVDQVINTDLDIRLAVPVRGDLLKAWSVTPV